MAVYKAPFTKKTNITATPTRNLIETSLTTLSTGLPDGALDFAQCIQCMYLALNPLIRLLIPVSCPRCRFESFGSRLEQSRRTAARYRSPLGWLSPMLIHELLAGSVPDLLLEDRVAITGAGVLLDGSVVGVCVVTHRGDVRRDRHSSHRHAVAPSTREATLEAIPSIGTF